jgi:hypothetical protein
MASTDEARMLKRVEGGYIFQPPPSIFHRTQAYRVNEAQKAEILVLVKRWKRWFARGALALAVASAIAVHPRIAPDAPIGASYIVFVGIFIIAFAISQPVANYVVALRLRPLLAGIPRSDEELYAMVLRRTLAPRWAVFICALLTTVPFGLVLYPEVTLFIFAAALLSLALAPFVLAAIYLRRQRREQAASTAPLSRAARSGPGVGGQKCGLSEEEERQLLEEQIRLHEILTLRSFRS